tara:strand:- start:237 stop:1178 length:942 start_codon:yes stop_codon:yes gene_type:complete
MSISKNSKLFIAGHNGLVGSSCLKLFKKKGYTNIVTSEKEQLNLKNQSDTKDFFNENKFNVVINCAAKVGGILANYRNPYQFILDNILIQTNLINSSLDTGVDRFIFLGSSCIYPKFSKQPIKESELLCGKLEHTNEFYAIAKISGVKLIEAINKQYNKKYMSLMPTNLYGPGDNFDLKRSHVIPALIKKFHEAKEKNDDVELYGDGSPLREFLHVDDLSNAIKFILEKDITDTIINVGYGKEISISALSEIVRKITNFKGNIFWDKTKPNGTPRKLLDTKKLNAYGWCPNISLEKGISNTYEWYKNTFLNKS